MYHLQSSLFCVLLLLLSLPLKISNETTETLLNAALAQIKRNLGVFFFLPGLLQSEVLTEVGGVISIKASAPLSAY